MGEAARQYRLHPWATLLSRNATLPVNGVPSAAAQVSRNYLAALQHIAPELDAMGVEVVAVSGDPRERAEAFVRSLTAWSLPDTSRQVAQVCARPSSVLGRGRTALVRFHSSECCPKCLCCARSVRQMVFRPPAVRPIVVSVQVRDHLTHTDGPHLCVSTPECMLHTPQLPMAVQLPAG